MRAIITKFHGPTNTKPLRVTATDTFFSSQGPKPKKVTLSCCGFDSSEKAEREAVVQLCRLMDREGKLITGSLGGDGNVWVFLPYDLIMAHKGRYASDVLHIQRVDCTSCLNTGQLCQECNSTGKILREDKGI